MKANEIREMSVEDLKAKLEELVTERFNLRFRDLRRDIARLQTILREKENG